MYAHSYLLKILVPLYLLLLLYFLVKLFLTWNIKNVVVECLAHQVLEYSFQALISTVYEIGILYLKYFLK